MEQKPRHKDDTSPLRTYSTDLAEAVRMDESAVIKAAMEEERRHEEEQAAVSATSPRNKFYIIGSFVIVILAFGAVIAATYIKSSRTPDIIASQAQVAALITTENTASVEIGGLSNDKIVDLVRTSVANIAGIENQITNLYLTDATSGKKLIVGTVPFLTDIKSRIPPSLLATLSPMYMLGIYKIDGAQHPFLILQTNDFQTAFADMFTWERDMYSDFYLPFNLPNSEDYFTLKFSDDLVDNKAVRIVKNDNGDTLLMYGFVDEKSLIITDSIVTFREVLHRIQNAR